MFQRVENTASKEPISTTTANQNTSSIKFYNDGIGINAYGFRYSVRLSNFSFGNVPKNLVLFTSVAINIGVAARTLIEDKYFTVVNTLNGVNHFFHYGVQKNEWYIPVDLKPFTDAIANNSCNAIYNPDRQNEYADITFKTIYALPKERKIFGAMISFSTRDSTSLNYMPDLSLRRDSTQPNPIFGATEDCLKKLLDETYKMAVDANEIVLEQARKDREIILGQCVDSLKTAAPYLLTMGLFSAGCYSLYKYRNHLKNQNKFSTRLERTKYNGFIDPDLICPISLCIMDDPVKTNDKKTYDRASIEKWLEKNNFSPLNPSIKIDKHSIKSDVLCKNRIARFLNLVERGQIGRPQRQNEVIQPTSNHRRRR